MTIEEGIAVAATALGFFGFKIRVDRQEKEIDKIREGVVWKETCNVSHSSTNERLNRIENKLDALITKLNE